MRREELIDGINLAASVCLSMLITCRFFLGIGRGRTITVCIALFWLAMFGLAGAETAVEDRRKRNEEERAAKDNRNALPGIPWYKVQFTESGRGYGDPGKHVKKVQKTA
jgi:hypothetical protein